jgi:hypothetical protein
VSDVAESEYDATANIFPKAFPWLFPGGVGDVLAYRDFPMEPDDWAQTLLYYYDGRFARDKFWTFYALNFVERRRNQKRGTFFVNTFSNEKEKTLEEIVEEIKGGRTAWLEKISYYSANIKGSSAYWRSRRNEVYSWISHHVGEGHGPPNYFITFSCAEYWWDDIRRLIVDRFESAGLPAPKMDDLSKVKIINDYTIVVQEYFQLRVQEWLDTVGKQVFRIRHYWGRFEFAPSRGQIHLHLLAIADFNRFFAVLSSVENKKLKAQMLSAWATSQFRYDCDFPSDRQTEKSDTHPASIRYSDVPEKSREIDLIELKARCQYHSCSGYCMRKRTRLPSKEDDSSKKRRVCRFGAGVEETPEACDTPGFPPRDEPEVLRDVRGFDRLEMPRTNRRITQTSAYMLQSWRANCDLQIFLYTSDPRYPDLDEIASVTDYIVAYACKGNETNSSALQSLKRFVLDLDKDTIDTTTTTKMSRMVLNQTLKSRMVPKQEATVHLAGLRLWTCSDTIERVSLSSGYKLQTGGGSPKSSMISRYANRLRSYSPEVQRIVGRMCLDDYFHFVRNGNISVKSSNKTIIPHYVGAHCAPTYPVTAQYARYVLAKANV